MSESIPALTPEDIHKYFEIYKAHMDEMALHEEKLYTITDHDEWIKNYIARSEAIRSAYTDNTRIGAELELYISGRLPLQDDLADALFDEFADLNLASYDDPFYAIHLCKALLSHYEGKNNLSKVILLLKRLGWEAIAAARIGYKGYEKTAFDAYSKILTYIDNYSTFSDMAIRRSFFVAYYNIICVMPSFDFLSYEKAFEYYGELEDFYYSQKVRRLDANTEPITELYELSGIKLLYYEAKIVDCNEEAKRKFCDLANKIYMRESGKCLTALSMPIEPVFAYYRANVLLNHITYEEAVEDLLKYYKDRKKKNIQSSARAFYGTDGEYYFETLFPDEMIFTWLKDSRIDKETRDRETAYFIREKNAYYDRVTHTDFTAFYNESLTAWCFKSLDLLPDYKAKETAILHLVLNRQIQTFFHSYMVADLSCLVAWSVLNNKPELFSTMYPGESKAQIRAHEDDICTYLTRGALLHDIGKNRIANVINMQARSLTDEEFELIKKHPSIGADSIDEDFDEYYDIILGHHKFYNGQGGYPEKFNPVSSRKKIFLDIITLCDSIDAATDHYGRNYTRCKTFEEIKKEFLAGAGSRYNPDLVDLLFKDKNLNQQISDLVGTDREEKYYKLVKEHLL